jgi:predicted acyltransferase
LGDTIFWQKTLKRFLIIFLLGYLLYWFPFYDFEAGAFKPINTTRILGVLQRIALCYLVASVVLHYSSKKVAVVFSAVILLGYWLLLYINGDANDPYSLTGYWGNAIDFYVLGEKHLYHGEGVPFDPEGILSTLPSVVNVIFGYIAGDYIRKQGNKYETIAKLLMAGAVLILLALTWNMVFPINKKIWTSSFVLLTVGLDLLILPILMFIIEIEKRQKWTYFFVVFGRNPLFIYLLSELLLITLYLIPAGDASLQRWLYKDIFGSIASPVNASFLFAFFFMLTCWAVGYILDRKKIYIRV